MNKGINSAAELLKEEALLLEFCRKYNKVFFIAGNFHPNLYEQQKSKPDLNQVELPRVFQNKVKELNSLMYFDLVRSSLRLPSPSMSDRDELKLFKSYKWDQCVVAWLHRYTGTFIEDNCFQPINFNKWLQSKPANNRDAWLLLLPKIWLKELLEIDTKLEKSTKIKGLSKT